MEARSGMMSGSGQRRPQHDRHSVRSATAGTLHGYLLEAIRAKDPSIYKQNKTRLCEFLKTAPIADLFGTSVNGFSNLDDIIRLAFIFHPDNLNLARARFEDIWETVTKILEERSHEQYIAYLSRCSEKGYGVLQNAICTKNTFCIQTVIKTLEAYPEALKNNLNFKTEHDQRPLMQVLFFGSLEQVNIILQALAPYDDLMENNLSNLSMERCSVLDIAAKTSVIGIFERIVETFRRYPVVLNSILHNKSNKNYMLLHSALKSPNPQTFEMCANLLEANPSALASNLAQRTKDGFMALSCAMYRRNKVHLVKVLTWLDGYPDSLVKNLRNRTSRSIMPLLEVLQFQDRDALSALTIRLKRYPNILKQNLEIVSDFGDNPRKKALSIGDANIIQDINALYECVVPRRYQPRFSTAEERGNPSEANNNKEERHGWRHKFS